jgi:hypothetical protein
MFKHPCPSLSKSGVRTVISFELYQFPGIRFELREKRAKLPQKVAQRVVKERRSSQGITDSGSLPTAKDQLRAAQDGELVGNLRLRKAQHLLQVAHTEASSVQ